MHYMNQMTVGKLLSKSINVRLQANNESPCKKYKTYH